MVDVFNVGISALVASQRQLSTTGHNIANVNTEGYSRQRVDQITRVPQFGGNGFVGKGVEVNGQMRGTHAKGCRTQAGVRQVLSRHTWQDYAVVCLAVVRD